MTVCCAGWVVPIHPTQQISPKHEEFDEIYYEKVVYQVGFSLHDYIAKHGQKNIKKLLDSNSDRDTCKLLWINLNLLNQ